MTARPQVTAFVQSCEGRKTVLQQTLADFAATDWGIAPTVELDVGTDLSPLTRQRALVRRILERVLAERTEYLLLLEDDLEFNVSLRHNLEHWSPLSECRDQAHLFAVLYNPGVRFGRAFPSMDFAEVDVSTVHGSQALLMSRLTVRYILNCWGVQPSAHIDLRLHHLAARVCPILCHTPSLVQHRCAPSTWDGFPSSALDFDKYWVSLALRSQR